MYKETVLKKKMCLLSWKRGTMKLVAVKLTVHCNLGVLVVGLITIFGFFCQLHCLEIYLQLELYI